MENFQAPPRVSDPSFFFYKNQGICILSKHFNVILMLKVQKPHLDEHQDSDVLPVLYHQPYRKIIPSLCLFSITIPQAACFESLGVPSKFLSTFHQLGSNGAFGRDTHCDFWFGISLAMAGSPSHSRRCRLDQPLLSSWKVDMQSDTQKTNAQVGGQGPGVL